MRMPPRSVWSGALSFGLLNIPVKLMSATKDRSIRFNLLHKEDGGRIRNQRICAAEGEPVDYDDTVKGYKVGPDQYVRIEEEDLEALEPEKSRTIDIEDFVKLSEIDPLHFDRSYHVVPEETATKAYRLLMDAMEDKGMVAIGRFVMREKEHLVAIRPKTGGLLLETMRFPEEVVPSDVVMEEISLPEEVPEKELKMAEKLIEALATEFDPSSYHDEHRERVMELIEKKLEGGTISPPERPEEPERTEDILKALEASVEAAKES